jgi:hypothetical protein
MNEEYQKLHDFMLNSGMTTLSAGDWHAKYSQPENFDKFYSAVSDPDTDTPFNTNLGKDEFFAKYMGADVKKKDNQNPQNAPSTLPVVGAETSAVSPSLSVTGPIESELPAVTKITEYDYGRMYQGSAANAIQGVLDLDPSDYGQQIFEQVGANYMAADQGLSLLVDNLVSNDEAMQKLGIDVPMETSYTGYDRSTSTTPRPRKDILNDRRAALNKKLRTQVFSGMVPSILNSIPESERTPEKLRDLEQHMLENYNSMIDLSGEGEVGNTPFLDADVIVGSGGFPVFQFSGYIADKFQSSGMDLINGFYNFFGGEAATVEERRKKAEEIRRTTLQFTEGMSEGDFSNGLKQLMGFTAEAAPIMAITIPAGVATGGLGLGVYATAGLVAAESAAVNVMQEWGRIKYNPEWSLYKKDGKEYSYSEMMMATGGDPEAMAQYTEDDNFTGKIGYLSNVGTSSMLTDGASTLFFLRALKGVSPVNAVTRDMETWWKHHLQASGVATVQGSAANSLGSMQQYIAQQEALGNEVNWSDVRGVGIDAAIGGGFMGGSVSLAGSGFNIALARDPFGHKGRNMEFYRQETDILQRYGQAKTAKEKAILVKEMDMLNQKNQYRMLQDQEFYSRFSEDDAQQLIDISHKMNQKYRELLAIADPENKTAKKLAGEIDDLYKKRLDLEEPYETQMMLDQGQDPTVTNDDGSAMAIPLWSRDYIAPERQPIEPLDMITPRTLFEESVYKTGGIEGLDKFRSYYESLVDALDAPRRLQQAVQDQTGQRVPISQDLDIAYRLVESKGAAMIEDAKLARGQTLVPMLQALNSKINKKTSGAELLPRGVKPTSLTMLDRYLYALHAPERNQHIYKQHEAELTELKSKKNPSRAQKKRIEKLQEYMSTKNGSGMSDADAAKFIDALDPAVRGDLDKMVGEVRNIQQHTRDVLLEGGIISKSHYDYLNSNFENYVNLAGRSVDELIVDSEGRPVGDNNGLSNVPARLQVNRDMLREALGRSAETTDLLGKTLFQESSAIIMASRNQANQKMLNLVEANPDPTTYTVSLEGKASDAGTVVVYRNGEANYIRFKDPSIARNMKYMDPKTTDAVMNDLGWFMRQASGIRKFFVNYNPTFGPVAYARDTQTAYIHALSMAERQYGYVMQDANGMKVNTGQLLDKLTANQAGSMAIAMGAETRGGRGNTDMQLGKIYEEFRSMGGKTGWAFMDNLTELNRKLTKEITPDGKMRLAANWFKKNTIGFVESMNNGYENAARFNAYRSAREMGVSPEHAAAFAKYVTVDFNRRGTAARNIGAWKFFFNPAAQGIDQSFGVLGKPKPLYTPEGRKRSKIQQYGPQAGVVSSLAALGIGMSEWNDAVSGVGPDGVKYYDKIPDAIKRRNIIVMMPGTEEYVKFPKTYGYGGIYDMGVAAYDMTTGKRSMGNGATYMTHSLWENFMPFYTSEMVEEDASKLSDPVGRTAKTALDLAAPDALKPAIDLVLNQTPFGSPVYTNRKGYSRSGSARRAPEQMQYIFDQLNELGGGTEFKSGEAGGFTTDYNPDGLWYLGKAYLGGMATFSEQTANTIRDYRSLRASDWPNSETLLDVDNIPFARQFYSDSYENQLYKDYYDMKERMAPYRNEFNDWQTLNKNIQVKLADADTPLPNPNAKNTDVKANYDKLMGQMEEGSQEFRYLAYLSSRDFQNVIDQFLRNEGLEFMYDNTTRQLNELGANAFSPDSTLQKYAELSVQKEGQDAMRLALIATYLNYANQVMPPRK